MEYVKWVTIALKGLLSKSNVLSVHTVMEFKGLDWQIANNVQQHSSVIKKLSCPNFQLILAVMVSFAHLVSNPVNLLLIKEDNSAQQVVSVRKA